MSAPESLAPAKACGAQIGAPKNGLLKIGLTEPRMAHECAAQIGFGKIRARQVSFIKQRTSEFAALKLAHLASTRFGLLPARLTADKSARTSEARNRVHFERLTPRRLARSSLARLKSRPAKSRPASSQATQALVAPARKSSRRSAAGPVAGSNG